jgi:hypothetical protein
LPASRCCVVDRHAGSFVQDLDAEDLHGGGSADFVRSAERDVERKDLVAVPGLCDLLEAGDFRQGDVAGENNIVWISRPVP